MATPEDRLRDRLAQLDQSAADQRLAGRLSKLDAGGGVGGGAPSTPTTMPPVVVDTPPAAPTPRVTAGPIRAVGVPQDEVARLAGQGNIAANLTIGASDAETRARLQPVAEAAREATPPLVKQVGQGLLDMTVAPVQRAVFSPTVGEARPDPRLSKGGNSANAPIGGTYDAEHGAITPTERRMAGAQSVLLAAAPAIPLPFEEPAATAVGRVAQQTARNAIVGASVNAPIEAAKEAIEAQPGERLVAAGKGLARGALEGGVAGAALGGAGAAIGETMASLSERRLATRLATLNESSDNPTQIPTTSETPSEPVGKPAPESAPVEKAPERPQEPAPAVPATEGEPTAAKASVTPPAPKEEPLQPEGVEERFSGPGLPAKAREATRVAYRSAMVTPYAEIEKQAPELANALMDAGAAPKRAEHIATRRMDRVFEGMQPWQKEVFGKKLVLDNLDAEAEKKAQQASDLTTEHRALASDDLRGKLEDEAYRLQRQIELMPGNQRKRYPLQEDLGEFREQLRQAKTKQQLIALADQRFAEPLTEASVRFRAHAATLRNQVTSNIESEPWFQRALGTYKTEIETPLRQAAFGAGVAPSSLREPASAYIKLVSEQRAQDEEIRRALDIAGVKDESELRRRPALLRKVIGENPELQQYFALHAQGPRQGPIARQVGPQGGVPRGPSAQITGSARQAMGTAESYLTDVPRILQLDAPEKVVKAARNQILVQVRKYGRELEPGEAPRPGRKVLAFDDTKGLTTGDAGVHRYEVTPEVARAVRRYYRAGEPRSAAGQAIRTASDLATRGQISGMPVEATSHANTLASIVGSVPGEKDAAGKALAAIPGVGPKIAAIRELLSVDFSSPKVRALENRLADIGALRIDTHRGGLINSSHQWLFGPEGVDVRGRLALARKYLARKPNASDAQLREFVTSKLGNYVGENAGALPNFMAKGSVLSPFARFQAARIPTAVKTTFGESGLPARSVGQKALDVANTLYRGPVGHVLGAQGLNYALTGHSTLENEPGHELDVNTGLAARAGGIGRPTGEEHEAPLYLPAATLNPIVYAGLRATGLRSLLFSPGTPASGREADAARDVANVVLGTSGPFARALMIAATGSTPFLQRDGTFLRVAPRKFNRNSEIGSNIGAAFGQANPALHAFNASSGDAGASLGTALEEDGRPLGGPASIAARVAEFTVPRVLSPGVGGRTNQQSVEAQLDRQYRDALAEYQRRVQRAVGPKAQQAIIDEAARDAKLAGFDGDGVVAALEKTQGRDETAIRERRDQDRSRRMEKVRP